MCWKTSKRPYKQVAHENIEVIKFIGKNLDEELITPYQKMPITLNKACGEVSLEDEAKSITKHYGYHTYNPHSIHFCIISGWMFIRTNKQAFDLDYWYQQPSSVMKEMYLAKCVIPKGSTYYENEFGEILSSNLIITNKMAVVNTIIEKTKSCSKLRWYHICRKFLHTSQEKH